MKKKGSGCGGAIAALVISWFLAGLFSSYFGDYMIPIFLIAGVVIGIVILIKSDSGDGPKPIKPAPVPADFSWEKANKKFREIDSVYHHVSSFIIESKGEIASCELIRVTEFEIASTGYWTVKLQYIVNRPDGFAQRHGENKGPLAKDVRYGDYIEICNNPGQNGQYIIDHLYRGLDVCVELNVHGFGYLLVYTDIPGAMPREKVKSRFESFQR